MAASLSTKDGRSTVTALAPGHSARLVIVATTEDGRRFVTVGAGHGNVLFDSFTYAPGVVQMNKPGIVSMPADPRVSEGQTAHLRVTPIGHPDVVADLEIPVRYDIAYQANFSGSDGFPGIDGFPGTDGMSGSDGALPVVDPSTGTAGTPGPGGNGSDGGNGTDGGNGGDGSPGGAAHIWMRLTSDKNPLLQIKAVGNGHEFLYLVDPNGGSLKVLANGGRGGRGGSGGRAGRGGTGGVGFPSGQNGLDGRSGFDGRPGNDGAAGTITVSADPNAQMYLANLHLSNSRGDGRPGPAPTILIESVQALW
ncbi:MAG TPA: hypothetical protein VHS76_10965 [Steroidobacteraceae bacterium]|jgi:hypothetical protein|nr:hypothetical protein [Steroidobacteraceae bacterium]